MTTTLSSIQRLVGFMPSRDSALSAGPELRKHLLTATALILDFTGMVLAETEQVFLLDTVGASVSGPLASMAASNGMGTPAVFDLPVRGALTGLTVRYRAGAPYDDEFDWEDAPLLVQPTDYIYEPGLGRIRLRFNPQTMVHGLRVSYTTTTGSAYDVMVGEDRKSAMASMGLSTTFAPAGLLFTGVQIKGAGACASCAFTAPGAATIDFTPEALTALHKMTVHGPRDGTILASGQATTVKLEGVPLIGSPVTMKQVNSPNPLPLTTYQLPGDPATAYPTYRLTIEGAATDVARVSFIDLELSHTEWKHAEGYVAPEVSEACAMLAYHLYKRGDLDGIGKDSDRTGRSYSSSSVIPPEVKQLLRSHMRTGGGVTLI
jgi:hypothetical protein